MKKITITILFLSIIVSNIFSQSLATNILFEQAAVVYKGRVEQINYSGSDAEGDDFVISTAVEKVYKNNFYGDRIKIRITKFYEIDTVLNQFNEVNSFQIKEDSTYLFFIQVAEEFKGNNGRYIYFANLADNQIEGIPFSTALEHEIDSYDQSSYLKTHSYGSLPFKLLFQSSPITIKSKVIDIEVEKDHHLIFAITESDEQVTIKTKELNCICETGRIEENKSYLFFLTPFDEGKYLLTDQWLGVFDLKSIMKYTLTYYKNRKATPNKVQDNK